MEIADNIDSHSKGKNKPDKTPRLPSADFNRDATVFVIDHHHSTLAAKRADCSTMPLKIIHDYSQMTPQQFWDRMWKSDLLNLNNNGPTSSFDDPYRSLARDVRKAGGYNKAYTLYEEFQWANFLRQHIDGKLLSENYHEAVRQAVAIAQSPEAKGLPGYSPNLQMASLTATKSAVIKSGSKMSKKKPLKSPKVQPAIKGG